MDTRNLQSFSMNSTVAVKLTEDGHKCLDAYISKNQISTNSITLNGDVLEMQLWELMKIFGPKMSTRNYFVNSRMLISGDDLTPVVPNLSQSPSVHGRQNQGDESLEK